MSELPQGWELVQLGSVGTWGSGGTPKRTNEGYYAAKGIPWLVIGDLTDGLVVKSANSLTELGLQNSSAKLLPIGTLLVAMYGSIGKLGITGIECATNQAIAFCRPNEAIVSLRYLYHALFDAKPRLLALGQGGAQQNISQSVLKDFQIALAPKNEQTRIANQLDTLLTRVQACNDRFDAIPALLKRFRNSVLAAAVSGRLTGDLRSEDSIAHNSTTSSLWRIPASWRWVRADEVTGFITKGTTPSKEKMTSGRGEVPYIKVYNLGFDGRLDFSVDPTFVDSTTHSVDLKRSITLPGDVLMNIVGPPLGKVAIVPDSHQEWNINQAIARFRPVQGLLSPYLAHCLMSTELISYAVSQAKATVGQLNLTLEICRALPIPMPPEKEQTEIVRRVEVLFALADRIEARCTAARTQAQRLSPLVLAKAFRGELVPQDPNDEPASALLARIASSNTVVTGKNKLKVPVALNEHAQKAINL
jgi:type I restriction enzyme, S subunit